MGSPKKLNHTCTLCGFKCAVKYKLEFHIRQHTGEKPFVCDKCNRGFKIQSSLNVHIRHNHQGLRRVYKKKYNCSLCSFETVYKPSLQQHIRVHTGERAFPCTYQNCNYAARCTEALQSHICHKHNDKRPYVCKFPNCDYRSKTAATLKRHSLCHSGLKPYVCNFAGCNYRASRKDALNIHQVAVHHDGSKPFACSKCSHRTHTKVLLAQHHHLVHTESLFMCNVQGCEFSCKLENKLKQHHLDRHMPEGTCKCDVIGCQVTAASPSKLRKHKIKVHEQGHQCQFCDYRVDWKSKLRRHIERNHTNKRIPCPTKGCTFQAKNRDSLKLHMGNHKAKQICPIEGCDYLGVSSYGWKRHMRFHDPTGRPYKCHLCPKYFTTSSGRSSHLNSHTKEKPYKCPACDFGSVNKIRVQAHVRSKHPDVFHEFPFDEKYNCDHCGVNFGCAVYLAMHNMKVKTPIVLLTRLKIE